METGRLLLQKTMHGAERSAYNAQNVHVTSRRNHSYLLFMRKGHFYEKQKKSGIHITDSGYCGLSDRRGAGRRSLRYRGDRARDHIIRKFEKRKGQKAVSDRYHHRSRCDRLHDSPLCLGRTASGGDAEGTAPSSDNDVERSAGRRYGEHGTGRDSDTDCVSEAYRESGTDNKTDAETDGDTDRKTDAETDGCTDENTDTGADGCTDRRTDAGTGEDADGSTDRNTDTGADEDADSGTDRNTGTGACRDTDVRTDKNASTGYDVSTGKGTGHRGRGGEGKPEHRKSRH